MLYRSNFDCSIQLWVLQNSDFAKAIILDENGVRNALVQGRAFGT